MVESVKPGFLNLKLDEAYLADYVAKMQADEGRYGCEKTKEPKTIMIDYGGPNVAKPLHVGHLRSAIIGESIKRLGNFLGHHMIVDAQSLIGFLKDIIELYCTQKYEGVPAPKEMASYIEQIQKDLAYEAGSKAQLRDMEFFQKEIESSEPIYNGMKGTDKLEAARQMFQNPNLRTAFNASGDTTSALDIFHLESPPSG